ncbi:MAG: peptidylprolyl isomerase [Pseudomonadota bacterium]
MSDPRDQIPSRTGAGQPAKLRRRFKGDPSTLPKPRGLATDPQSITEPGGRDQPKPSTPGRAKRATVRQKTRRALQSNAKADRKKPARRRAADRRKANPGTHGRKRHSRVKPLRVPLVLAVPAAYFLPLWRQLKQLASGVMTVWRGAEEIDSQLWRVFRVGVVAVDGAVRWLADTIMGSLVGLARWLPTRAGRGYCAFFGLLMLVSGLWIADEIRTSDRRTLARGNQNANFPVASDGSNPILARLDGDYIRLTDVERSARLAGSLEKGKTLTIGAEKTSTLLNDLIDQRLLARAAIDAGLHREPALDGQLALARERLLAAAFLDQQIAQTVTPQRVEHLYTAQADVTALGEEIRARHILVETRAEAIAIITKIDRGADFSTLARSVSLDRGTAPHGGDMGVITRDMVSDEFARIAFTVDAGALSLPFKTSEGWNIVEVLEKRKTEPVAFDGVRGDLERFLELRTIDRTLTRLRETYDVTLVPQSRRPAPATPVSNDADLPLAPEPTSEPVSESDPSPTQTAKPETTP